MSVWWTVAVAALLAVPLFRVGMYERRHRHAHHAGPVVVEQPAEQDFYGSMDLDAERGFYATNWLPAPPDEWDDATLASLHDDERIPAGACGLDPAAARCAECPYWPICRTAADEHWNDPAACPPDWRDLVAAERGASEPDSGPGETALSSLTPGPDTDPLGGERSMAGGTYIPHRTVSTTGPRAAQPGEPPNPAEGLTRLADTGEIHAARQAHPHPGDGWLDAQLAELYEWVRTQLEEMAAP